ncbi:MAG TPA: serine/threonine-protein kinase [Longimicrobiaceae bacterium]|nr:serine/threonine-protein kinase [Longimicrobiaceae bacterium]
MYGIEGLLAGHTLQGRYRIDEVVGRGGMGAVYRGFDTRLGREVAVKVISVAVADPATHEQLRGRFQREARAAAALHHPNVMAVYDFGTDPTLGLDFLVMELLRGEDLSTRLVRKGPPALPTALGILLQAARGLAAGHRAGLIHRDVKPGNLFLEPGDQPGEVVVKLLDFGIAEILADGDRTATHLTLDGRSPYSPAFASPEQMRGLRVTPATDVFSLAAVGFQLLTGKRAFSSADPERARVELASAVVEELPRVPGLSPDARQVMRQALAPDPRDRFPNAAAFAEALAPLVAGSAPAHPTRVPVRAEVEDEGEHTVFLPGSVPEKGAALARARPGWLARATRSAWNFTVTATAATLCAGCWAVVLEAFRGGLLERVFLGAGCSVFLTPLAVHRLLGHRGSYRFALFGSVAASAAVVYLLGHTERMEVVLGSLLAAQLGASVLCEWLTRGATPANDPQTASDDPYAAS